MALEDRAIIVGISKYPDLGDLNGPENDAKDFYDWVVGTGGVNAANAKLILSSQLAPAPDFTSALTAEPTTAAIYLEIERLNVIAEENEDHGLGLRVGKRLYLYFAGHGFGPRLEEAAILMANARNKAPHHVPGRLNALRFLEAGLFEEVILLMDCCREVQRRVPLAALPFVEQRVPIPDITKRFFGYSCKHAQLSKERIIDGETHGVFSAAVMAGLRDKLAAVDGRITAASLGSYVYDNMKKLLEEGDLADDTIAKEPDLDYDTQVGNQFVISTVAKPVPGPASAADPTFPVTITFSPSRYGKSIDILDSKFAAAGATTASAAPWTLPLHRAIYALMDGSERMIIEIPGNGPFDVSF